MVQIMARMSAIRPVNRIKHVIDSEGGLVIATQSLVTVVDADDNPVLASPAQVQTGAVVNGIYLHVEVSHTSGAGRPNMYLAVMKNPGNNIVTPTIDAIGVSDAKKFIIHQEMIMLSGDAGNGLPRPIFNGVIVIPKHMRRFGPDDRLVVILLSKTVTGDFCLQCHYKEFR